MCRIVTLSPADVSIFKEPGPHISISKVSHARQVHGHIESKTEAKLVSNVF